MRILGISGSPRVGGNTDLILNEALNAAKSCGAEVKLLRLCDYKLEPCIGCMTCFTTGKCAIKDDWQKLYDEVTKADALILASPSYFQGVTAQMKTFIDRIGFLALARKRADFKGKVGGVIAVARRSGVSSTCNQMLTFLTAVGAAIPSGGRVFAIAREKGDILKDQEGMETAKQLGNNLVKALA
jgi:multimeric flavodoxin WrbA